jgi:hypothetical protein
MKPSARPMSIWARPLLVGLLAIGLLATAGAAVAAPTTIPTPAAQLISPPADAAAPVLVPAPSEPQAPWFVSPTSITPPIAVPARVADPRPQVTAHAKTVAVVAPKPKVVVARVVAKTVHVATRPKTVVKHTTVTYSGVYHLWIPGLGLSRSIHDWGCNGGLIPNLVEYWGCAGTNNLYLLGHAWGVFAPIHDGYHSGALHVGLTAYYADKAGKVHKYRISQIRHVAIKDYASWSGWAIGSSSSQVITLQTCDGATSSYRILVRLVPV